MKTSGIYEPVGEQQRLAYQQEVREFLSSLHEDDDDTSSVEPYEADGIDARLRCSLTLHFRWQVLQESYAGMTPRQQLADALLMDLQWLTKKCKEVLEDEQTAT